MNSAIDTVLVVIPARDEAATVDGSLASVALAGARLAEKSPAVRLAVCLVADACTDATAEIARRHDGVAVVEIAAGNVGLARAAGARRLLGAVTTDAARTWIATTDADSVVPPNWLLDQVLLADGGADAIVGTVTPDFGGLDERQRTRWLATHVAGSANGHVHGANLGIRASVYLDAGGFAPLTTGEDVDLVARIAASGAVVIGSATADVVTSSRRQGRAPDGYAAYLATLR